MFHESYSNLLTQLPPSLIKAGWIRLTMRKRSPLTENEASSINPIIESFLKHEVDRYQRKKQNQYNPIQNSEASVLAPIQNLIQPEIEEEINARVKEATDTMHQKFIETTQETLNSIKQQKDAECKQIKLDMAIKGKNLFESTLKKYIRDGTIYHLIHLLEEEDGTLYPNTSCIV